MAENPNIEFRINGSCVWIYFDGVNHYTMPTLWWEQEISLFDKIIAEIEGELEQDNHSFYRAALEDVLKIIDKYKGEQE